MPRVNLEKVCHINAWEIHGSPTYRAAGSKVGTCSNVDKTCALGLLCTGFVMFMAKYTNSTLFDPQIRDAAEQHHHPGQYNKLDQCEEDAVRRFLST